MEILVKKEDLKDLEEKRIWSIYGFFTDRLTLPQISVMEAKGYTKYDFKEEQFVIRKVDPTMCEIKRKEKEKSNGLEGIEIEIDLEAEMAQL